MTHVTCRLTAKNRDQLPNATLGNRVWATFTFLKKLSDNSSFLYLAACFKCIAWTRPIATDELAWSECVCVFYERAF